MPYLVKTVIQVSTRSDLQKVFGVNKRKRVLVDLIVAVFFSVLYSFLIQRGFKLREVVITKAQTRQTPVTNSHNYYR